MIQKRKILLVEDNETHAHLIQRHLRKSKSSDNQVVLATTLLEATQRLSSDDFQAVLLDLSLPDSPIHETLDKVVSKFALAPVIVLTSLNDLDFANRAVQQGAQDYLVKTELNADTLDRAIRYAIERKRAQRQLEEYALELKESNQHLEAFAHTLAHEVRSPLTVVSGSLQVIKDQYADLVDPQTLSLVNDSMIAVSGMTELVESLLEFSQASQSEESSHVELESTFFYVSAIVRPMFEEIDGKLNHDALPTVVGIEAQLRQLLQNLIVNAVKYRREENLIVDVSCQTHDDHWLLSVSDNGRGIAVEDQSKIFEAFTRLENKGPIPGAGIGLAFCKRIVDNHQGKIWVESEIGAGSTFLIRLPNKNEHAE